MSVLKGRVMQVKVEKYKGEKALEQGIAKMLVPGWQIQNQAQRKQAYSLATGVFTKKQIHTVTYVKP
jgi:hypothetical protein